MFCNQCQETLRNSACTMQGVCGKDALSAELQDLLIFIAQGVAHFNLVLAEKNGKLDPEATRAIYEALFTTVTNVNFDPERIEAAINRLLELRFRLQTELAHFSEKKSAREEGKTAPRSISWNLERNQWRRFASTFSLLPEPDQDLRSLKELILYGLKGIAAYAEHALLLGYSDQQVDYFVQRALIELDKDKHTTNTLFELVMNCGENAVKVMELLDRANTSTFGHPEVSEVETGTRAGPGILISGHDLLDLKWLLEQTAGKGINIYTHGEMLPANAYPELKKFPHLVGNYGSSWYNQQKEFSEFSGPILMTTNCLQKPLPSYQDRIFTTGLVAWPGVKHIFHLDRTKPKDFSPLIDAALQSPPLKAMPGKKLKIGFAHQTILSAAEKIVNLIQNGRIKKFIVMAGCDGRFKEREYFTQFARALSEETIILTAGCAKYRYNYLELGSIEGIPRILDAGQCNDSYSLAYVALKLKEVFGLKSVSDLPIEFNIAWYEQKAVTVLLALLALGFKRINLGPTLPAFLSPNIRNILIEKFQLAQSGNLKQDLSRMGLK